MARTDRDSWDLATSVGALATDAGLIEDPYAAELVRAVGIDVYVRLVNGQIPVGGDAGFDPQRMAQGMACRTRFYDQFFLDAADSGVGQAVILASGLDARAYRLPWPAGTVVYEVDMPEVIEFKTLTLGDLGAEPTAERRTVAIDPKAPAAWSAEGLLVYLPDAAQDALFDNITALSAPGSRLAFEFVPDTAVFAGKRWRAHHDRMTKLGFEVDLNELVYHGQRSHIVDYLAQRNWQTSRRTVKELHAINGFAYPDDAVAATFADVTYTSSVLVR